MRSFKIVARKVATAASLAAVVLVLAMQTGCDQSASGADALGKSTLRMAIGVPSIIRPFR